MDYAIIEKLNYKEYREFIKNALGFANFISMNNPIEVRTHIKGIKRPTENKNALCYLVLKEKKEIINTVYVDKINYQRKSFNLDSIEEDSISYFLKCGLTNSDILFLLMSSKDETSVLQFKEYNTLEFRGTSEISNILEYSFILGAGINSDYKVQNWAGLIENIGKIAETITKIPVCELEKFSKKRCNTNYYMPQISKDLDRKKYFKEIEKSLYDKFNVDETCSGINPKIEKYNLYQVARILTVQTSMLKKQDVITFNYDNILELILKNSFNVKADSLFRGSRRFNESISIIHTHGFLPYKSATNKHKSSIVLSHDEYLKAYSSITSYSYNRLYNQLHKRNIIIGNSLSDYEEQKVFYNHHKVYLNEFSYALIIKEKNKLLNCYTVYSLYKMGIIPIFFEKIEDINSFLKTFWPSLE